MARRGLILLEWHPVEGTAGHPCNLTPELAKEGFTPNLFGGGSENPTITVNRRGTIEIKQQVYSYNGMPQAREVHVNEAAALQRDRRGAYKPVQISFEPNKSAKIRIDPTVDQAALLFKPQTGQNMPSDILFTIRRTNG